jgi:hypothetical protein
MYHVSSSGVSLISALKEGFNPNTSLTLFILNCIASEDITTYVGIDIHGTFAILSIYPSIAVMKILIFIILK